MENILKELGNYVKNQRKIKNLTLVQVEKITGIDNSNWSKIESARIKFIPKFETLRKIANVLDINIIELYIICGYLTDKEIESYQKSKK